MTLKIGHRLLAGFAGAVLVCAIVSTATVFGIARLGALQDEGAGRAGDAVLVTEVDGTAVRLYQVVADMVINRGIDASMPGWTAIRTEMAADLDAVEAVVDTPEERAAAQMARDAFDGFVRTFEETMLPALRETAEITPAIRAADAEIDGHLATLSQALREIRIALDDEMSESDAAFDSVASTTFSVSVTISILAGIVLIAVGFFTARSITNPIARMTGFMNALADGDKSQKVPDTDRGDEIGEMAKSVAVFREKLKENDRLQEAAAAEQAERDRRARKVGDLTKEFEEAVGDMLEGVSSAVTQLSATANSMTGIATNANEQASSVAAAAEQATGNVETVSAASEELSGSIAEITRQVAQSTDIATQAVQDADDTNRRVQALQDGAQKIGDVVSLITSIAEQTNLLALNATIEAARAGDAGKGFAVVASEVKSLANQTGKATEEIAQQIQTIQTSTGDAVEAIDKISRRIKEMANISTGIAAAVEEQDAATQEIARNVQEAATGTRQVSTSIVSVSEASRQTGAAAGEVESASGSLAKQSDDLKGFVETFLNGIRTA